MNIEVHPVTYAAMLSSIVKHPKLFDNISRIHDHGADGAVHLAGMKVDIRIDQGNPRDGIVVMRCTPEEFETLLASTIR